MEKHIAILNQLVTELFSEDEQIRLQDLVANEIPDAESVLTYDDGIAGPSIRRLNCIGAGRYAVEDRDIFRPLQYCAMNFRVENSPDWKNDPIWHARDLVENSSLHIESLIKNIGRVFHFPLGKALRNTIVRAKLDNQTWTQIDRFTQIYNDAKHNFSHEKDTHMFAVKDALLSYFVCRKLGLKLYPLTNLVTDIRRYDQECGEKDRVSVVARRAILSKIQE